MEWRTCPNYPEFDVSEYGDVRRNIGNPTRRIGYRPKGHIDLDGYLTYSLRAADGRKTPVQAHTLVAEAFLPPKPTPKHEVAHGNGSRVFHHFTNLRWATRKENHSDIQIHLTAVKGTRNGRATITDDDVRYIRAEVANIRAKISGTSWRELCSKFDLTKAHLMKIAKRQAWSHVS